MSRSIDVAVEISDAAYSSNDRVFNKLKMTVTDSTDITDAIFVVNVTDETNPIFMYVATPADLTDVSEDTPDEEGLLRVTELELYYDTPSNVEELIASIRARIDLLISTLNALDVPATSYNFTSS